MKSCLVRRFSYVFLTSVVLCGLSNSGGGLALADPILPGFDLLNTPPAGGVLDLSGVGGPAAFPLQGRPIGPGNTDTIVQRFGTLPPGGTGPIPAQLVALSLESIAPVFLPGPGAFFDVFVDLDPSLTSPGQLNILTHNDPLGGVFTSIFTVNSRTTFTQVGNPLNTFQVFRTDTISSPPPGEQPTPWSHFAPLGYPENAAFPSGEFYPGALSVVSGSSTRVPLDHTGPHPHTLLATPEPGSVLLLTIGVFGLALRRFRQA